MAVVLTAGYAAAAAVSSEVALEPSPLSGADTSLLSAGHHHGGHHHQKHHKGSEHGPKKASFDDTRPSANGTTPAAAPSGFADWTCNGDGCWPLLFMIGVQKSATTSLFKALEQADTLCGATWFPEHDNFYKEAHYFDRDSNFDAATGSALAATTYTKQIGRAHV